MAGMLPALPNTLRAGDTLADLFDLSDYQAPTWVLHFALMSATTKYTADCLENGTAHELSVDSATTAAWVAGSYTWVAYVTSGDSRITLSSGSVQILPDLVAASSYDGRTPARKALEAAEAALADYGSKAYLQEFQIGDRRQKFSTPGDFLAFVDRLRAQVRAEEAAERIARGLAPKNKLLVRFTR